MTTTTATAAAASHAPARTGRPLVHRLMPAAEAAALIAAGHACMVAGDEAVLRQLPRGLWVGGSIPYFMAAEGGVCSRTHVFVTEVPAQAGRPVTAVYDASTLPGVCRDAPLHGYTLLTLPAFSAVHEAYAQESPGYDDMFMRPLVGWISGVHLSELQRARPCVVHGPDGQVYTDRGVALHVPLPLTHYAHVDIVNLFRPGHGPVIEFEHGGFTAHECRIDGHRRNLHDWMAEHAHDMRLPLVADYCGAHVNVSIKALNAEQRSVDFYAPVFAGVTYRPALPVTDYVQAFEAALRQQVPPAEPAFCCNCILNYAYGGLEGRRLPAMHGPATFGEIGYQLLNQTLVYLSIVDAP